MKYPYMPQQRQANLHEQKKKKKLLLTKSEYGSLFLTCLPLPLYAAFQTIHAD